MPASLVTELLESIRVACFGDRSGVSKDPIPELNTVDPDAFGICLATVDGHLYEVGDTRAPFPIQSISKVFTYGLALSDRGIPAVAQRIDVEPSGEPYNEISLDRKTGRPRNPMINAGALTACALIEGAGPDEQFKRVRAAYSAYAGRELLYDDRLLRAQIRQGDRNRAIGYLLREFGTIQGEPEDALEVYLRQCSLLVDCRDLALMAATLANAGVQPNSGDRVLTIDAVDRVLSVMTTCGMYDGAGDWAADVGLPAKSGVGGGIIAVLPGQLAVAVYSPRLDEHGNSVRGVAACRQLSRELQLHFLHVPRGARSAVESVRDLTIAPSLRERPAADLEILRDYGHRAQIVELHGDLLFAGAEAVVRQAEEAAVDHDVLVFDASRVGEISPVTWRLVLGLRAKLREHDCLIGLVDPHRRFDPHDPARTIIDPPPVFAHVAVATAWAEDRLLDRYGERGAEETHVDFAAHPLLAAVPADRVERLREYFEFRTADAGTRVVRAGDSASGLYLLLSGWAHSTLPRADDASDEDNFDSDSDGPGDPGDGRRVATLSPGTGFGQASLVTGRRHAFDVDAERRTELAVLTPAAFAALGETEPALRAALVESLMHAAYDTVDRLLRIVSVRADVPVLT